MNAEKYQIDMCHGPLFGKIILFALPLVLTNMLQLVFNAADLIVIGHYASHEAMAAIGATMNMNATVLSVFIGLSVGSNVVMAQYFGSKDNENMSRTVHTSMALAFWGGIVMMLIGLIAAKPLLILMGTPSSVLPKSCSYIWICFASIPFIMIYNFGNAILRAVGDTRRPFCFLIIAGTINVLLNLFLVIKCHMDVEGVAIATAASHAVSAILILMTLLHNPPAYCLFLKRIRIDVQILKQILKTGVPAGLQGSCFGISNMAIQSSINSFGAYAMAGITATLCLESIVYIGSYSFHQTAISFVAQNLGGRKFKRIQKSIMDCFIGALLCNLVVGWGFFLSGETLLKIFNTDPEVVRWGLLRMKILFTTYFLCGFMDVASGALRGLGYSMISTILCLVGACVLRLIWIFMIFPYHHTMSFLLLAYPVSWLAVGVASVIVLIWAYRKLLRDKCPRSLVWTRYQPGVLRGFRFIVRSK